MFTYFSCSDLYDLDVILCTFQPYWNNLHQRSISSGNLFRFVYIYYYEVFSSVCLHKVNFLNFILVVVVKTDDTSCHKSKEIGMMKKPSHFGDSRMKSFTLSISKKISYNEYLIATFGAFGIFVGFYILVLMISCVLCIKDYR